MSVTGRASLTRGGNPVRAGDLSCRWLQCLRCGCYERAWRLDEATFSHPRDFLRRQRCPGATGTLRRVGHRPCELTSGGVSAKAAVLLQEVAVALASRPPRGRTTTRCDVPRLGEYVRSVRRPTTLEVRPPVPIACLVFLHRRFRRQGHPLPLSVHPSGRMAAGVGDRIQLRQRCWSRGE